MNNEMDSYIQSLVHGIGGDHDYVQAVALGGSIGTSNADNFADLDLAVFVDERPLFPAADAIKRTTDQILSVGSPIVSGPTWKEGFGCRISYIYADGLKIEVFVNTPTSAPRVDRVLRLRPLSGADRLGLIQEDVRADLAGTSTVQRAIFAHTYGYMSIMRHASRAEFTAVRYVAQSLLANGLATLLWLSGGDYDPYCSYKRVTRDGHTRNAAVKDLVAIDDARLDSLAATVEFVDAVDAVVTGALLPTLTAEGDLRSWHTGEVARSSCRKKAVAAAEML